MSGSLVPERRVYMSSRPGSGKSLLARIALNPQIMMLTGGGDVNLLKDGERRFLMVDLEGKSPENVQAMASADEKTPTTPING